VKPEGEGELISDLASQCDAFFEDRIEPTGEHAGCSQACGQEGDQPVVADLPSKTEALLCRFDAREI
jgi:hypothetical protein